MLTPTLAILIFDDVEVLDFCGPFEVFSVANRFTNPPAQRPDRGRERRLGRDPWWPQRQPAPQIGRPPPARSAPGSCRSGHPQGDAQPGADAAWSTTGRNRPTSSHFASIGSRFSALVGASAIHLFLLFHERSQPCRIHTLGVRTFCES